MIMNQGKAQSTEPRHYQIVNVSVEEAQSSIEELAKRPRVRRMIQSMEAAISFREKYDQGLYLSEAVYMASRFYSGEASVYDIVCDIYNLGFMRGYNKAKRGSTRKRGNDV